MNKTVKEMSSLFLRRPQTESDYRHLEHNSQEWDIGWGYVFSRKWFSQPPGNSDPKKSPLQYWNPYLDRNERIAPQSKNWCVFLLLDEEETIWGRHLAFGVTERFRDRHLNSNWPAPLFPVEWKELRVPDPAEPETGMWGITELLVNLSDRTVAAPILRAATRIAGLFSCETLFTQVEIESNTTDRTGGRVSNEYGLRKIRRVASPDPRHSGIHFEVWAWERDMTTAYPFPQVETDLNVPRAAVPTIARFYQGLTGLERRVLLQLLYGNERLDIAQTLYCSVQRVDQVIREVRDCLIEIREELAERGVLIKSGDSVRLHALLLPLADTLRRLAWFYGDEVMEFNGLSSQ